MSIITITSILVTFCALFSYLNYRFIKLPTTIGIMVMAMILSAIILFLPILGIDILPSVHRIMDGIDFSETLLHGMLSFLLFAGALHVNWKTLQSQKYIIGAMALFGTVLSTALTGLAAYKIFPVLGFDIPFIYALLFGALISPTDPIAVMAILKKAGAPKTLEIKVVGESLFNDGIAVVLFLTLLGIATHGETTASHVALLFVEEAIGGAILGGALGYVAFIMLRSVDNYQVEILLTLAMVMGGYELANALHTSGPIAMVVAGLIVGNVGRDRAMSDHTKQNLDNFWELIDEFLNAILFLLLGFSLLIIEFNQTALYTGLIMIPLLLLIRYLSVLLPVSFLKKIRNFSPGAVNILTWGGLRGGISVALVLSLPSGDLRDFLLLVTYCIVMFSIIVQGLTIGKLVRKYNS
ncbi:MAG: sodium:proton antiporter [Rhodospirillales bacterium]|nr:sodium:proton antiporter [Alphaproteobacteria bacterium]USO04279.1 MAG: sodium:proton antiporter [Rhodospirillales bacterium]